MINQRLGDVDGGEHTQVPLENTRTKLLLGLNRDSNAVARAAALLGLNAGDGLVDDVQRRQYGRAAAS